MVLAFGGGPKGCHQVLHLRPVESVCVQFIYEVGRQCPCDTLAERPTAGAGAGHAVRERVASPLTSPRLCRRLMAAAWECRPTA